MIERLKSSVFFTAIGIVVVCLLVAGFLKGFSFAHVSGIVALFVVHHRDEIVALFKSRDPKDFAPDIERLRNEFKTELSKLAMFTAFKAGVKPGQSGADPQT